VSSPSLIYDDKLLGDRWPTEDEYLKICQAKRLSWVKPRVEDYKGSTIDVGNDTNLSPTHLLRQFCEVDNIRNRVMENACDVVRLMGYEPADCVVEHHHGDGVSLKKYNVEYDVLLVLGKPCYEVKVTTDPFQETCFMRVTITPRLIAWPPQKERS
jgi:hypothetical protein